MDSPLHLGEQTEFADLLSRVLDGSPDSADLQRLSGLMRQIPSLQENYIDLMRLHAMLIWREGQVAATTNSDEDSAHPDPLKKQKDGTLALEMAPERQNSNSSNEARPTWRQPSYQQKVRRAPFHWLKVAAMVLLGISLGLAASFVWSPPVVEERENGAEIVSTLVGWNLDIAEAESNEERQAIYNDQAPGMQVLVASNRLSREDRVLAATLVETGAWLTRSHDPMAEAERFSEIADVLLASLDSATVAQDQARMNKLAESYRRLTEVGVSGTLERLSIVPDPKRKLKLDHLIAGNAGRAKKLEELLDRHPDASWKAIHRALKGHHHKISSSGKTGH